MTQQRPLYRRPALERFEGPADLDELVTFPPPRRWLLWLALGLMAIAGVGWTCF